MYEEFKEKFWVQIKAYHQHLKKYYDKKVRIQAFKEGELVLKCVMHRNQEQGVGMLGLVWEGPYRITGTKGNYAYYVESLNYEQILRLWNIARLKKIIMFKMCIKSCIIKEKNIILFQ